MKLLLLAGSQRRHQSPIRQPRLNLQNMARRFHQQCVVQAIAGLKRLLALVTLKSEQRERGLLSPVYLKQHAFSLRKSPI